MPPAQLGLIINPIAGIGGRVGLKGSDGAEVQRLARQLGGAAQAQERAAGALSPLLRLSGDLELLTAPGAMGENVARVCGFNPIILRLPEHEGGWGEGETSAEDTSRAANEILARRADLLLFAGGDGTARDICAALGSGIPALGIPAGVKIYSAVFAVNPHSAGELVAEFLTSQRICLRENEVLDIDEDAYRQGEIVTRLYGYLNVPYRRERMQNQKVPTPASEAAQMQSIAAAVIERMHPGQAYLLGPGTTTRAVAERLGLPKTLVGVDILTRSETLALDVSEQQILAQLEQRPLGLIITPTGGQGFLFGRGNQQLSPQVLRRVGRDNILVIAPASKIAALHGNPLLVDTGDPRVDSMLEGYMQVITGYRETVIYRVSA